MPTIASTNSDAEMEKNGTPASPATARASSVLPVPGRPASSTPRGIRPPSFWYFSGFLRKSTTSASSPLDSSMPATSSNVTFVSLPSTRRALERPNAPSAPICPPAARRESHTNRNTSRITGPNPSSRRREEPAPVVDRRRRDLDLVASASCSSSWSSERRSRRRQLGLEVLRRLGLAVRVLAAPRGTRPRPSRPPIFTRSDLVLVHELREARRGLRGCCTGSSRSAPARARPRP